MREITSHIVNPVNDKLAITARDEPGAGGANHEYQISWEKGALGGKRLINFQNGPIAENGINGVTQEALLAIVADRLNSFQNGPFACLANEIALEKIQDAIEVLHARTKERMQRGVEGRNVA